MNRISIPVLIALLFLVGCKQKQVEDPNKPQAYVPKDLNECFAELQKVIAPGDLNEFKNNDERQMTIHHFNYSIWMRNNWGLQQDSRLAKWFEEKGINHPDDMSAIVLISFHRYLNGKNIELEAQIDAVKKYREEESKKSKQDMNSQ
jgi:hypothetical protein